MARRSTKASVEVAADHARPNGDTTGLVFYHGSNVLGVFNLERISKARPDRGLVDAFQCYQESVHGYSLEDQAKNFAALMDMTGIEVNATTLLKAWRRRYGQ